MRNDEAMIDLPIACRHTGHGRELASAARSSALLAASALNIRIGIEMLVNVKFTHCLNGDFRTSRMHSAQHNQPKGDWASTQDLPLQNLCLHAVNTALELLKAVADVSQVRNRRRETSLQSKQIGQSSSSSV